MISDVPPVLVISETVMDVDTQELTLLIVSVLMVYSKPPMVNVKIVTMSVLPVKLFPPVVPTVEVTDYYQIVPVQEVPMKPSILTVQSVTTDVLLVKSMIPTVLIVPKTEKLLQLVTVQPVLITLIIKPNVQLVILLNVELVSVPQPIVLLVLVS